METKDTAVKFEFQNNFDNMTNGPNLNLEVKKTFKIEKMGEELKKFVPFFKQIFYQIR